jgi:hypothetical protein
MNHLSALCLETVGYIFYYINITLMLTDKDWLHEMLLAANFLLDKEEASIMIWQTISHFYKYFTFLLILSIVMTAKNKKCNYVRFILYELHVGFINVIMSTIPIKLMTLCNKRDKVQEKIIWLDNHSLIKENLSLTNSCEHHTQIVQIFWRPFTLFAIELSITSLQILNKYCIITLIYNATNCLK